MQAVPSSKRGRDSVEQDDDEDVVAEKPQLPLRRSW